MKTGSNARKKILYLLLFLCFSLNLNAGWITIKLLNTGREFYGNNIHINIKTHEIAAVQFKVNYRNNTLSTNYYGKMREEWRNNYKQYKFPDYIDKWSDKQILIPPGKTAILKNVIYIHPLEASKDTVMIWYEDISDDKVVTSQWVRLYINVEKTDKNYPAVSPEPEFTRGVSNQINWFPIEGSSIQELYYFDDANPENLKKAVQKLYRKSGSDNSRTAVFENLTDGHKYGYFARSVIQTQNDTLYMCSDITYSIQDNSAPEKVYLIQALKRSSGISLTWKKVEDNVSNVEKYIIYRAYDTAGEIPVDTVLSASSAYDIIEWIDKEDLSNSTYYYRVRALDAVGNLGDGERSNGVTIDNGSGNGDQSEEGDNNDNGDSGRSDFIDDYISGPIDTLWIDLDGRETALKFESVRDSLIYFNSEHPLGMRYFCSSRNDDHWIKPKMLRNKGWVSNNNVNRVYFIFDYSDLNNFYIDKDGNPQDKSGVEFIDKNFVNGHTFHRRIIRKYSTNTDTMNIGYVIPDCYAPADIHNLMIESVAGEPVYSDSLGNYFNWFMKIKWQPAEDQVSGIKEYHVYRKIKGVNDQFIKHKTLTVCSCVDTFNGSNINNIVNPLITYRIGSLDYAGNLRTEKNTDWEVEERALWGPVICFHDSVSANVKKISKDTLFTEKSFVILKINNFDKSDVIKYEINTNGNIFNRLNTKQDTLSIKLSSQEISRIKIRASYLGKRLSKWSDRLIVIRALNSLPEDFNAENDSTYWEGGITLSWRRSSLDAVKYEIFRDGKLIGEKISRKFELTWLDRYGYNDLDDIPGDTLTVYQDYSYKVKAVNLFNNKSAATPTKSSFCNLPPLIDRHEIVFDTVGNDYDIFIYWNRAGPTLVNNNFSTEVDVFQDDLNPDKKYYSAFVSDDDTTFILRDAQGNHNYIFRIREIPNNGILKSGWSKPYTVSGLVTLDSLQSLPLPNGKIYLNWYDPLIVEKFRIDSFKIKRSDRAEFWTVPVNISSLIDSTESLKHNNVYKYSVFALDTLGQIVSAKSIYDTCDTGAAFIPDIDITSCPKYFNLDSIDISWIWKKNGNPVFNTTEGAATLMLQVSISRNFPLNEDQTTTAGPFSSDPIEKTLKVKLPEKAEKENEKIYLRITAWDKWFHPFENLWSTDFYPVKSAIYDPVPSPPVSDFSVAYQEPYNLGQDSIIVFYKWSGKGVEDGDRSKRPLLWNSEKYQIYRKLNGSVDFQLEIPVQKNLTEYQYTDTTLNRDYLWQVNVIDSAGNITEGQWTNTLNYLQTPQSPIPTGYRSCKIPLIESDSSSIEYFVEIAMNKSHFFLAYSMNDNMSERMLCQSDWINDSVFTCSSGWGSIFMDTTWFRMKIRNYVDNNYILSGWSILSQYPHRQNTKEDISNITENPETPDAFSVLPNTPNPFNNQTIIRYQIPQLSNVDIFIYNMRGSIVKSIRYNNQSPGSYSIKWDGSDMNNSVTASGIYICHIIINTEEGHIYRKKIKMIMIK